MVMTDDVELVLTGDRVVLPGRDEPVPATIRSRKGRIDEVVEGPGRPAAADAPRDAVVIEAGDRLVAPGLVDVHGDAFERCLMPRPGVTVDVDVALADNDAQLLGAGITTSLLSATDSWEPGLRSRATLRSLVDALARRRDGAIDRSRPPRPDVRLHVRHERCNTDDLDHLLGLVAGGEIALLSYNDHTRDRSGDGTGVSMTQVQRSGVDAGALGRLEADRAANRERGREQERELAALAARVGCPTASHDPGEPGDLDRDRALGIAMAEFPFTIDLARRYREAGIPVLLGAPNLVRGGSHLGNLSVAEALTAGAADLLCSDYHYPSLLQAPFAAADRGLLSVAEAWRLVADVPARVAGLTDRGRIETGLRADLVVVDRRPGGAAVVDGVVLAGTLVGRLDRAGR